MLTKLFLLIVLYANVLCSASYLEHFVPSIDFADAQNLFFEGEVSPSWNSKRLSCKDVISVCAEQCYLSRYICKSFVILGSADGSNFECLQFGTSSSEIFTQQSDTGRVAAVYNIREQITDITLSDISLGMRTKPGEEWVKDILEKYGGDSVFSREDTREVYIPLLLTCWKIAMHPTPPKALNFENKILSTVKGQEKGRTENREQIEIDLEGKTATQMIINDLASWTVPSQRCSSPNCFHFMALTFLQIFGGNIRKGVTTHFNEENGYLFFEEEDMHLLVGFPNIGAYYIIWGGPTEDDKDNFARLYGIYPENYTRDLQNKIHSIYYDIFSKLMIPLGHNYEINSENVLQSVNILHKHMETSTTQLILKVADILLYPRSGDQYDFVVRTDTFPFFQDLMAIMVSDVNGKNQRTDVFQSRLDKSRFRTDIAKTMDITIITSNGT